MNLHAWPHRAAAKLRALFRRDMLEQEMHAEMAQHLARATERLMERGLSREKATLQARREFGNVGVLQKEARSARGGVWLDTLRGDLSIRTTTDRTTSARCGDDHRCTRPGDRHSRGAVRRLSSVHHASRARHSRPGRAGSSSREGAATGARTLVSARALVSGVHGLRRASRTLRGRDGLGDGARHDGSRCDRVGDEGDDAPKLRDHLRRTLPELPAARMQSLADNYAEQRREVLQLGSAAGTGAVPVLLLASIGLYGVIGLALLQRRREIGVRVALGAKAGGVVWLLFRQGVRLAGIGMALGPPLSIAAAVMTRHLAGDATDLNAMGINPVLIASLIALSVIGVASIATWLPARRAAHVDPMIALRAE